MINETQKEKIKNLVNKEIVFNLGVVEDICILLGFSHQISEEVEQYLTPEDGYTVSFNKKQKFEMPEVNQVLEAIFEAFPQENNVTFTIE